MRHGTSSSSAALNAECIAPSTILEARSSARVGDRITDDVALLCASQSSHVVQLASYDHILKTYTVQDVTEDEDEPQSPPVYIPPISSIFLRTIASLPSPFYPNMELCCRWMRVPLGLLTHRWAGHGSRSAMQPMARRYFSLEAVREGQSQNQKRTAIVTGSGRGMYDRALSLPHLVSDILMLTQMPHFSVVKPSLAVLLTMDMPSLSTTSQPTRPASRSWLTS
jgi:hypothetical protein